MSAKNQDPLPPTSDFVRPEIDSFRAQHLALAEHEIITEGRRTKVVVNESESPLIWLAPSARAGRSDNDRATSVASGGTAAVGLYTRASDAANDFELVKSSSSRAPLSRISKY